MLHDELARLATGFALGLSLAAPPGPVNALIARESVRGGWRAGVRAGLPAPIVDTAYMLVVLFGLPRLFDVSSWTSTLLLVGSGLMAWLAWQVAKPSGAPKPIAPGAVWGVTLSNPFQYAWWLSAGTAFLGTTGTWGIAGFLCAIFGWVFVFSFGMSHAARRWSWLEPVTVLVSADGLFVFAIVFLMRSGA